MPGQTESQSDSAVLIGDEVLVYPNNDFTRRYSRLKEQGFAVHDLTAPELASVAKRYDAASEREKFILVYGFALPVAGLLSFANALHPFWESDLRMRNQLLIPQREHMLTLATLVAFTLAAMSVFFPATEGWFDGYKGYKRRLLAFDSVVYLHGLLTVCWFDLGFFLLSCTVLCHEKSKLAFAFFSFNLTLVRIFSALGLVIPLAYIAGTSLLKKATGAMTNRVMLAFDIMRLLELVPSTEEAFLLCDCNAICGMLRSAGARLSLAFSGSSHLTSLGLSKRVIDLRRKFQGLETWILFPQTGTSLELRRVLLSVLNIVLSGKLHELDSVLPGMPEHLIVTEQKPVKRALISVMLLCYFVGPLFLLGFLTISKKMQISGLMISSMGIAYGFWVLLGLAFFGDLLPQENRSLIIDVLKARLSSRS